MSRATYLSTIVAAGIFVSIAQATLPTVTVGNVGNPHHPLQGEGSVGYVYSIARFEVTAGQYTEFLNAVAATDTYGLWVLNMNLSFGARIARSGSAGSYTYSVAADRADRPVSSVSWGDAARFANWMHNGKPTGPQGLATTEDGSYFLNGATTDAALLGVTRKPDATWVIPTADEWFKAAYHWNDGPTANYFAFPTSSNIAPSNVVVNPDPGNSANHSDAIGSPYYRTVVGEFENSASPYGTFDQGGNVSEWNETFRWNGSIGTRGVRGGSYSTTSAALHFTQNFNSLVPSAQAYDLGFRLAYIPEPTTAMLLLGLVLAGSCRGRLG